MIQWTPFLPFHHLTMPSQTSWRERKGSRSVESCSSTVTTSFGKCVKDNTSVVMKRIPLCADAEAYANSLLKLKSCDLPMITSIKGVYKTDSHLVVGNAAWLSCWKVVMEQTATSSIGRYRHHFSEIREDEFRVIASFCLLALSPLHDMDIVHGVVSTSLGLHIESENEWHLHGPNGNGNSG